MSLPAVTSPLRAQAASLQHSGTSWASSLLLGLTETLGLGEALELLLTSPREVQVLCAGCLFSHFLSRSICRVGSKVDRPRTGAWEQGHSYPTRSPLSCQGPRPEPHPAAPALQASQTLSSGSAQVSPPSAPTLCIHLSLCQK